MFPFEAFLGSELVAEAIVSHLVRARDNVKWWGKFVDHDNQVAARLIDVVGWMRLRMPAAKWKKLVAPLAGSKAKQLPSYCARLCELADDSALTTSLPRLLQRRSTEEAKKYFAEHPRGWFHDPQLFFVIGKDELLKFDTSKVKQLAKWQQLRLIDEMGTIQGPGAVRLITALAESKAAAQAAATWLEAHGGKAPPLGPEANERELEKEVRAIFTGMEKLLLTGKGDAKNERKVMDAAFARYAELRAAMGEVIPEAYFTHAFADVTRKWKADEATTKRWLDLAVEAASG